MPATETTWTDGHRALDIAVVGATGAVGRELIGILAAAGHPRERIRCFARAAQEIRIAPGGTFAVRTLGDLGRPDLAFLCTPSDVSLDLAPRIRASGSRVIDLSSAHRMHPEIPLVIPEINGDLLGGDLLGKDVPLVANPNCTTAVAALPLAVLDRAARLEEVVIASYQAASGVGIAGLSTLAAEMRGETAGGASPFPAPLALNVIPGVAEPEADGWTGEERKIEQELRKILRRGDLVVEATTVRVPVERCHSVAVHARFARDLSPDRARDLLAKAEGILLVDDPHGPRPRECAGTDPVHVGRVRAGARGARSLSFFAVGDQIRKGAALNAFQVAARLAGRV
jgi:aspartate-semialdehyde dehydrogenase